MTKDHIVLLAMQAPKSMVVKLEVVGEDQRGQRVQATFFEEGLGEYTMVSSDQAQIAKWYAAAGESK